MWLHQSTRCLLPLLLLKLTENAAGPSTYHPSALADQVRLLERENAWLRSQYGLGEPLIEQHARPSHGAVSRLQKRRRLQVPDLNEMVPSEESMVPPCDDPENCDCLGSWAVCSAECEPASQRTWLEARPPTGTGVPCPEPTDCGLLGLQDGECAPKPYNASRPCTLSSGEPCPEPPASFAEFLLRVIPMAMSTFVTFFGTKISTVVRVSSTFCASCAPVLMPVIEQIKAEGGLSAATFVGIGGAIYAGGLGAFAAVKKREFGIMVQGVAVGYVVSSLVQGFLIGMLLERVPSARTYIEWITMVFTFSVGGAIGKLSQKYEDIVSIGATAAMGAYAQLQTFATLNFQFTRNLSIQAAVAGEFGCTDWKCDLTLGFFVLYAVLGARNQVMMVRMARKIEQDPDFPGEGLYQQSLVKLNGALEIVFQLNELVKEQGKFHTEEELEELLEKNISIVIKLATVFSDVGLLVLAIAMVVGIVEGVVNGIFYTPHLKMFAAAMGVVAAGCLGLVLFAIKTHRLPHKEMSRRHYRMKVYLLLVAMLIPVVAGCGLVVMVMMPGTFPSIAVPQVQRFFDMDKLPVEVQQKLNHHLPTVYQTLLGALLALSASWSIVCKHLGGVLYLAMKLMSMVSWALVTYGGSVAFCGFYGAAHVGLIGGLDEMKETVQNVDFDTKVDGNMSVVDGLADFASSEVTLFHVLAGVGISMILVGLLGVFGMRVYYKIRSIGRIVLRVFNIMLLIILLLNLLLFGVCGYYYTQMDDRMDEDWATLERRFSNSSDWGVILDTVAPTCSGISIYLNRHGKSVCAKATFREKVDGSFNIMMIAGGFIVLLLSIGVVTSHFIVVTENPIPGKIEREGGESLKGNKLSRKEKKEANRNDTRTKAEKKAAKKEAKAAEKAEKLKLKQEVLEKEKEKKKEKKKKKVGVCASGDASTVDNPLGDDAAGDSDAASRTFEKEQKSKKKKKAKKVTGATVVQNDADSSEKKRLLAVWQAVDLDGSGSLDRSEVRQAMENMGCPAMSDSEFDKAWEKDLDTNQSGDVSFDEFMTWWRRQDAEAQQQLLALKELDFSSLSVDEV
eukprot:COSAG02_NODE_5464_length_4299_cov_15.201905_1_plen_1071_part_00